MNQIWDTAQIRRMVIARELAGSAS